MSEPNIYAKDLHKIGRDPELARFLAGDKTQERGLIALDLIVRYGGIDGSFHKQWVLDQVTQVLTGGNYEEMVAYACDGEDGPDTYDWDVGIAP